MSGWMKDLGRQEGVAGVHALEQPSAWCRGQQASASRPIVRGGVLHSPVWQGGKVALASGTCRINIRRVS